MPAWFLLLKICDIGTVYTYSTCSLVRVPRVLCVLSTVWFGRACQPNSVRSWESSQTMSTTYSEVFVKTAPAMGSVLPAVGRQQGPRFLRRQTASSTPHTLFSYCQMPAISSRLTACVVAHFCYLYMYRQLCTLCCSLRLCAGPSLAIYIHTSWGSLCAVF